MDVHEQEFFHTCVTPEGEQFFDENSQIIINADTFNPRHHDLINYKPIATVKDNEMGWLKYLDYLIDLSSMKGIPSNWLGLLENITEASHRLNNRYFERILEEIRVTDFSNLPSRYNCIYLADKVNLQAWHLKAVTQLKRPNIPIYKFAATGIVHYADAEWLEAGIVPDEEYKTATRSYWQGLQHPDSPNDFKEILFCGSLTKIAKYSSLEEYEAKTLD
jgi:hypothetical protein